MKRRKWLIGLFLGLMGGTTALSLQAQETDMKLWYDRPAERWVEALPLGNGRLGAMVYGNPAHERLQLNESTVWGGSPHNNVNPKAKEALPRIRELIFQGKNEEAQALCGPAICGSANGMPYQTVGSLLLDFEGIGAYTDYYRDLDLERAVATTRFTANGVTYTREAYTSFVDQLLVIRLTASKKKSLSFTLRYDTPYREGVTREVTSGKVLLLGGKANSHEGVEGKVRFVALTRVDKSGGTLTALGDSALQVRGANEVKIYVSIGTNFKNYKDVSGDARATAEAYLKQAGKNYGKRLQAHVDAYRTYFGRVTLDLGRTEQTQKPTDRRIAEFATKFDPQLAALYFQFGRYLLISSSQPGGQAANLQGVWNESLFAPWDGKYTTDINVEMNYWPAEVTALPEMHEPFLQLVKEAAEQGRQTAAMYGCRGWTLHHNTDIWRSTGAVDGPAFGIWPTCNAWFCQHLWDRYLFNGDADYLAEAYPLMRSACEFYLDFLVREPENGWLVVAPSYSPENNPKLPGRGFVIVAGATMDNQMLSDLFHNTLQAAGVVGEDPAFMDSLRTVASQLAPMQVGRWGQLQEWMEDWDDPNDHHRHVSHLWGLYPGRQISAYHSPVLFEAVKTSLNARGDESTGWSMGWKVCLWARLLDGNHAYKLITDQIRPAASGHGERGGTYPNLFDAHPPFQIDGNFGCAAGIAEMLVQSHDGAVHLLPALPDVWKAGTLKGIRCRGGFQVEEMKWAEGRLQTVTLTSTLGGTLRIRSAVPLRLDGKELTPAKNAECDNPLLQLQPVRKPLVDAQAPLSVPQAPQTYVYDVETVAGGSYTFVGD